MLSHTVPILLSGHFGMRLIMFMFSAIMRSPLCILSRSSCLWLSDGLCVCAPPHDRDPCALVQSPFAQFHSSRRNQNCVAPKTLKTNRCIHFLTNHNVDMSCLSCQMACLLFCVVFVNSNINQIRFVNTESEAICMICADADIRPILADYIIPWFFFFISLGSSFVLDIRGVNII